MPLVPAYQEQVLNLSCSPFPSFFTRYLPPSSLFPPSHLLITEFILVFEQLVSLKIVQKSIKVLLVVSRMDSHGKNDICPCMTPCWEHISNRIGPVPQAQCLLLPLDPGNYPGSLSSLYLFSILLFLWWVSLLGKLQAGMDPFASCPTLSTFLNGP